MNLVFLRLKSIDSTNTYAKQQCSRFATDKITCITAEEQTAGRGRFKRKWVSPPGVNLYATFFFQLPEAFHQLAALGQLMAYSCSMVLMEQGLAPQIKLPNDLLLHGKKFAGILCETTPRERAIDVFLGIGINVNMEQEALLAIDQPATSLLRETGRPWDKEELLEALGKQFARDLKRFKKEGFAPFQSVVEELTFG